MQAWTEDDDIARARRQRALRRELTAAMVRRHPTLAWSDDARRIADEVERDQLAQLSWRERVRHVALLTRRLLRGE